MADLSISIYDGISLLEDFGTGAIAKFENIALAEYVSVSKKEDISDFLRNYPFIEITQSNINVIDLGGGYEQILDIWGDTKKGFEITFPVNHKADAIEIREFYEANYGKQAFFTSPLDSVTYNVRIVDDSYKLRRSAYDTYFANISLIEVF